MTDPDSMPQAGARHLGAWLTCGLLVALVTTAALVPLDNNDVWIHLTTGRLILEEAEVPRVDRYSFTAEGNRYVAHEWLAATWYALAERTGGQDGVVLAGKVLPTLALLLALLAAARAVRAPWGLTLPIPLLATTIYRRRILARPELMAVPLLLATVGLLWRDRRRAAEGRRTRAIWLLVPLEALWANLHGSFVLGPVVVAVFAFSELLESRLGPRDAAARRTRGALVAGGVLLAVALASRDPAFGVPAAIWTLGITALFAADGATPLIAWRPPKAGGQGFGRLLGLAAAMSAAAVVNPLGPEIFLFPFEFTSQQNVITGFVNEWKPLFDAPHLRNSQRLPVYVGFVAAWLGALSLAARRGALGSLELGLLLALGLLPFRHIRWMGVFALATTPALIATLAAARARAGDAPRPWSVVPTLLAALGGGTLGTSLALLGTAPPDPWLRGLWALAVLPTAVALAVAARPRFAPALATATTALATGALLAMALFVGIPEYAGLRALPSLGARAGSGFGPSLAAREAIAFLKREQMEGRLFTEYPWAGYAIHQLWPQIPVFIDSRSEVYGEPLLEEYIRIKKQPGACRAAIDRHDIDLFLVRHSPPPGLSRVNSAVFEVMADAPDWKLLYMDDRSRVYARTRPGRVLPPDIDALEPSRLRVGEPENGAPAFEAAARLAVERAPDSAVMRTLLADSLRIQARHEEALGELREAMERNPRYSAAPQLAGEVALAAGRRDEARRWFERAREASPNWDRPRRSLESLGP